jgi:CBS domain-containing protein
MKTQDAMSHPLITAPASSTTDVVARLMWEFDCGIVPIVSDDDGRLVGVITDRDICMAAYTQGKPLSLIAVSSAMAKEIVACHAADPIESAERLMRENRVRRMPVLDQEDHPVGLISMNDIARVAAHAKKSGFNRELVETLATVCQPRAEGHGLPATNNIVPA